MAIFHMSGQIISRISPTGNPRSAISAAAYRSGEELHDNFNNETKFYQRSEIPDAFILAPEGLPEWVYNREKLWNAVEASEKQYNAQLAREFNIALPLELNHEEQKKLTVDFCKDAFVKHGMIADVAIHHDNEKNPHFHVMLTMRQMKEDGSFMPKCRKEYVLDNNGNKIILPSGNAKSIRVNTNDWNDKSKILEWRKLWEVKTNEYLELNGCTERISCLSNQERSLETEPTIHEGYGARIRAQKSQDSDRININNNIQKYNEKIVELKKYKTGKLSRFFSPQEKKLLCESARLLHTYIDINSIMEKEKQLSIYEKHAYNHELKGIDSIYEKQEIVSVARDVIEKEAASFFKKYYPGQQADLSPSEMASVVQKTTELDHPLSAEEVNNFILNMRYQEFKNSLDFYLDPNSTNLNTILKHIGYAEKRLESINSQVVFTGEVINTSDLTKIDSASGTYHIYQDKQLRCFIGIKHNQLCIEKHSDYMKLHDAYNTLKDIKHGNTEKLYIQNQLASKIGRINDRITILENTLLVMDRFYDKAIQVYHPNMDTSNMSMIEKEYVLGIKQDVQIDKNSNTEINCYFTASRIISNLSNQGKMHEMEIERIKERAIKREVEKEKKRNEELETNI